MKEIRTVRMVEQVDVVFVADDGKEFKGPNGELECARYERTRNQEKVKKEFERISFHPLDIPFAGCDRNFYHSILTCKRDFIAMMDYIDVFMVGDENTIREPVSYPYSMTICNDCGYVFEYTNDLEAELAAALSSLRSCVQ